jgi:hypothetical protein
VHRTTFSAGIVLLALASGCRSSERPAPDGKESPEGAPASAGVEVAPKQVVNSAAALAAIMKEVPLYPDAKAKGPAPWSEPGQFAEGKWGSSYEASTSDSVEKVLDTYAKAMANRGWTGARSFQGMMSFEKESAPGKLVTLAAGPDDKAPGQTLVRVVVVDK